MTLDVDEEFVEFVREHQHPLTRAAYLTSGDLGVAEDLVQEAFVKVAQRWSRLRNQDPAAYARRIIFRDNISRWRRTRREALGDRLPEPATDPTADVADVLDLRAALAALPPRQRAVVVLRHLADLSEAQVADILDVSVGTVKSQNHDAMAALREHLPRLAPQRAAHGGGD